MDRFFFILCLFFSTVSLAEGGAGAPGGPAGGPLGSMIPILLCFLIIYFLMIRPQQRKQRDQQKFINELKKGDMVITNAGIVGIVKALSEKIVTLEIDDGVCLKVLRNQILESATALTKEPKPA